MNRLDHNFKRTTVRDPHGMLEMAGRLDPGDPAEVEPFEREIVAPQKSADFVFRIRARNGRVRFEQLEALARWHSREPGKIAHRAGALLQLKDLDKALLRVTVVLLNPTGIPPVLPEEFRRGGPDAATVIRPGYVKLWEVDGDKFAASASTSMLPWVTLMRTSEETLVRAAARIVAERDDELNSQLVTLGCFRYDKEYLRKLLGRFGVMLTAELAAESSFGKEIKDLGRREGRKEGLHEGLQQGLQQGLQRGLQQGLQEGLQEGRKEEAVQALRTYLRVRFPSIAERPEVDRIAHASDPNGVLERAYRARNAAAVLAVLTPEK